MKLRAIIGAAAFAAMTLTTATIAQDDPVKVRQGLMKEVGGSAKVVGDMMQGKSAFDAAAAKAALEKAAVAAEAFPNHFPEGSDQGESGALPAIWQNKADFDEKSMKLAADARAAAAATDAGEDAFKAATGAMFGNCKDCHELYRKPT